MNNNEKFTRLRRLFTEYEALKSEKNRRIDEIQNLLVPGGLKENYIKEYKAFVDPKIEKVEDDIFRLIDGGSITCVLNREDAIRYRSEKKEPEKDKEYYEFHFGAWNITVDSDVFNKARYACNQGLCICDACKLNDIPACICCDLDDRYNRGEYRIIESKEE